jgi:peptide/nickel transport system permease protein
MSGLAEWADPLGTAANSPSVAVPLPVPEVPADEVRHRPVLSVLWHNRRGLAGCVLTGVTLLTSLCAWTGLYPYSPTLQNPAAGLKGPSLAHPFGTDQFGRDMVAQVMQGLSVSLEIAIVAVLIAGTIGTLGGIVAGYLGRWIAAVTMRVTDVLFAIPAILLALAIVTALGAGWSHSALAIGIGYIPIFVRVVRGPVLSLRESPFIRAGRVLGLSRWRLLFRHILPNVSGIVAVQVSLALAWSILAEATLSFLGLGPPPPTASLGLMVYNATSLAASAWWVLAFPSIAIIVAVTGFNLLGDGLRDATDPRARTT